MGILKLPETDKARQKTRYRQNHVRNEPAFQTRVITIATNFQVMLVWATRILAVLRAWLLRDRILLHTVHKLQLRGSMAVVEWLFIA